MKLIIFTPVTATSAIGGCSRVLSSELVAQGHEVTIVRTESEALFDSPTHDFGVTVVPWTDSGQVRNFARLADALIYQIGDNYTFHQGGVEWLASLPGIVCLHDFFLGHLFHGWAHSRRAEATEVLCIWYGRELADRYFTFPNSIEFIQATRDVAPLTEWICSMALGVITHSSWGCERILKSCPGPVRVVALALNKNVNVGRSRMVPVSSNDADHLNILTIGHVNPNKRVASVIRAIGSSPLLRQHARYRLVGAIHPDVAFELLELAGDLAVNLIISGEVDESTLADAIDQSDVICCLRWPSLEAASASLVEALLNQKAAVVTDTGFYSEVPDSCVLKIRPDNEMEDLELALELLYKDAEERLAISIRGQQWARRTFTPENYARELTITVREALKAKVTLSAIDFFVSTLQQWSDHPDVILQKDLIEHLDIFDTGSSR